MLKSIAAAACLCITLAQAQSSTLSEQQINDLVAGATVEIDTPLGTKLPIRYGRDGRLSGEARDLASYLGAAVDRGRWWVASDQLCHKWNRWFNSEPQCIRLSREGRLIRWRKDDGYSGTAIISVPATIQAAVVPPRVAPEPAKQIKIAPSQVPPAAASPPAQQPPEVPPAPANPPAQQPPEPAAEAGQPSQQAATETVVPPAPANAPATQAPAAPTGNVPPEPKRATRPLFKVVNVRGDDVLNVRSGPSADFDIVGELPPGSHGIAITSPCRSLWCPVAHGSTSGWVNSAYLAPEQPSSPLALRDSPQAPRTCLTAATRALLDRIEQKFGPVKVVSTCRPGAIIPGSTRLSRHASGSAVDFDAGSRKAAVIAWLIANHRNGGTMTYAGMDHIHVDIGPHFVSIANGPRWLSWRDGRADFPGPSAAPERR
jgi:Bacterial SH3 domain/Peptidase M15